MKIRVRFRSIRRVVELSDDPAPTFGLLRDIAASSLGLKTKVTVSDSHSVSPQAEALPPSSLVNKDWIYTRLSQDIHLRFFALNSGQAKHSYELNIQVLRDIEKIEVREHNRKLKKEGKLNSNKRRKDPGVPNSCPFKEEVLKSAEQRQIRLEEEREKEKERRKQDRQKEMDKRRNLASGNLDSL
ncbi:hypothetical protein CAPTEDRAFT_188412, partial [Capitella teleta]